MEMRDEVRREGEPDSPQLRPEQELAAAVIQQALRDAELVMLWRAGAPLPLTRNQMIALGHFWSEGGGHWSEAVGLDPEAVSERFGDGDGLFALGEKIKSMLRSEFGTEGL